MPNKCMQKRLRNPRRVSCVKKIYNELIVCHDSLGRAVCSSVLRFTECGNVPVRWNHFQHDI